MLGGRGGRSPVHDQHRQQHDHRLHRRLADGSLTLLDVDGVTATTDAGPIDLAGTQARRSCTANGKAGTAGIYAVASLNGWPDPHRRRDRLPVNSAAAPGMQGIVVT